MSRRFSASRRSFLHGLGDGVLELVEVHGLGHEVVTDSWMALTAVSRLACAVSIRIWLSVFTVRMRLMTSMPVASARL